VDMILRWTKKDIEEKLRSELQQSGFRPIEPVEEPEDVVSTKKRKKKTGMFQWSFRPELSITVRAEPDPDAVLEDGVTAPATIDIPSKDWPREDGVNEESDDEEQTARPLMKGESRERPY